jgi:uncharacterized protein
MEKEIRSYKIERSEAESRDVAGYAATYADYDMGEFIERIAPTAFDDLASQDIRALFNHDANAVLARFNRGKGTLTVNADERGLYYAFALPNTTLGNDVRDMLSRGDIDQSSWAFSVAEQEWNVDGSKPVRTITRVGKIYDVSLVTYPANPDTTVALRSMPNHHEADVQPEQQVNNNETIKEMENTTPAPEVRTENFVDSSVVQRGFGNQTTKDLAKFSPMKVIRELATRGNLTGLEAELNQQGIEEAKRYSGGEKEGLAFHIPVEMQKEARAQLADSTANLGGNLITPEFNRFVNFLWPNTPVLNLCSVNDNLQGDVIFPVESGVPTLNWLGEVNADTAENVTFDQVTSVPTRAAQTIEMSRRVLLQEHSGGLQSRLVEKMNYSFNTGIETALLVGSGSGNQPTGIMTALNASAQVVGVPTHADLINLFELVLANADALRGRLAYVTDPATLAFLKATVLDAGSGKFLAEGKLSEVLTSNGYPIHTTTTMPLFTAKHGMIFGNFEDVALNFWGGPVLMVNPYTKMKESLIEIYMERQMDVKVLRAASFAISKDIVYA